MRSKAVLLNEGSKPANPFPSGIRRNLMNADWKVWRPSLKAASDYMDSDSLASRLSVCPYLAEKAKHFSLKLLTSLIVSFVR